MTLVSSKHTIFRGPELGQPIYELGAGCSTPKDCTTYEGSKCVDGLCVGGYINMTKIPETTTTRKTTTTKTTTPAPGPTTTTLFPSEILLCRFAMIAINVHFCSLGGLYPQLTLFLQCSIFSK